MFPRTSANMITMTNKFSPISLFLEDYNKLALPGQKFTGDEIERILKSKGLPVTEEAFNNLRAEILGRKAIGTFVTSMVIGSVVKDKLFGDGLFSVTGDGSIDRQLDAARRKNSNFKPRSVVGPDGKRFEYNELLGPGLSNWVAAVANVADNFDMLGEAATENSFQKLSFILAAALTDPAGISALRPLVETMSGNQFAANRFVAGQVNSLGPLGGMRNEFGKILDGGLKDLNNNIVETLLDRNRIVGLIDNSNRLPTVISPISGEAPNKYSMLQRVWNSWSPLKIHPAMTKEEKFLYDIEYDVSSAFKKRSGVDLMADERNALNAEMGRQGYFKNEIVRISKMAESRNTIKKLKEMRRPPNLITSERSPIGSFDQIHMMLRTAQKEAEERAFGALDPETRNAIEQRIRIKKMNEQRAQQGLNPIPTNRY